MQCISVLRGIHCGGSFSPFERLDEAVTATRARGSDRSFANASRRAAVHLPAPESHASFSATTWSMSSPEGSVTVTLSYAEYQSPAMTLQPNMSTCAGDVLSSMSASSRVLQESPSASTQCLNFERA